MEFTRRLNGMTNVIKITKTEYYFCVAIYTISIVIGLFVAGHFMFSLVASFVPENYNILSILGDILIVAISLAIDKGVLTELIFTMKFYGLNIKVSDEELFLYTDNKKCRIPLNKNVNTMFCMFGWLIIWPSENTHEIILIRNSLLGTRFKKLESYFKSKTNFLSLSKEKRKVLKFFHINTFCPLKYVRWPKTMGE